MTLGSFPFAARLFRALLALSGAWLLPSLALAAGGEHEGELSFRSILTNTEFLASVENVALFVFILWWFGRKPIAAFLGGRRREMEQAMVEAAAMKQKAEARYKEYSERIAQLDSELAKLKADIERGAEDDRKRILAEAEEAAARMRKETEALVGQHAQALRDHLRREVVAAATRTAREVLEGGVNAADQQRLAEDFRARVAQERGRV